MTIESVDPLDPAAVEQLLDIRLAAHAADSPDSVAPCRVRFRAVKALPSPAEELRYYAVRADEKLVGYTDVHFFTKENLHFAYANVFVHPDYRRRGIGEALARHATNVTRAAGRTTITIDVVGAWGDGPNRPEAGIRLLEKLGFTRVLTEVSRLADITAIDPATEQRLWDESLEQSTDYETVAWSGALPKELCEPVAKLNSIFLEEAPLGDLELEPEKLDAERIRVQNERSLESGIVPCGVVARLKGSTELVANTVIGVTTEPGDTAAQWMTLVDPKHRGHRLGMRVKVENLRQLRAVRPAVRYIVTGNADSNAHMAAINESLGFKPVDASHEYQLHL